MNVVAPNRNGLTNEPRPFLLDRPRSISPVLLTCEHATRRLPRSAGLHSRHRAVLASHWGWDAGAWKLTRELARRLRAGAIGGRWSRLLIDLNRRVDDPTLIRRHVEGMTLPWNAGLDTDEIERRILAYHAPYHLEVDRLILRRLVRGVRPLVLAVHSFTPHFERRARSFEIGILYEHHGGIARRLGRALRESGLSVRYNQPYSGMAGMMYAVDRHGSHYRLPCLEIEINQRVFERETAVRKLGNSISRGVNSLLTHLER